SIQRLKELEEMSKDGRYELLTKKEVQRLERERQHLESNLAGIKEMPALPDTLFVVDSNKEDIAVKEARKLGIPVVAVVDTNCDPDLVDYVIPGNDDAIRASALMCRVIADAVEEGRYMASRKGRVLPKPQQVAPPPPPDPEAERQRAERQARARAEAAAAQRLREERLAAAKQAAAEAAAAA